MSASTTRLNKYIAHSAGLSRREADAAISAGRAQVNGATVRLGAQVDPQDIVTLDGAVLAPQTAYTYLLLNKPVGYLCSRRSQSAPTIYSLLPPQYQRLKSVGRLDKDSSGLLLLTDDGDFAQAMTHPRYAKTKTYQVALDHPLAPLHMQMIADHGVRLDDGISRFLVTSPRGTHGKWQMENGHNQSPLANSPMPPATHAYEVRMSEGRNRQIRRTFASLGYTVTRLHRVSFGPYRLTDEKPGQFHLIVV